MGSFVVKCWPDEDKYVYWSDSVEAPHAMGTRAAMFAYLEQHEGPGDGTRAKLVEAGLARSINWERLERADRTGTSAFPGFYDWKSSGMIFEQRGMVPRAVLWEFCERLMADDREGAYDLMEPFEDCDKVRRG